MRIGAVMEKEFVTVRETDPIENVLKIMTEKKVNGLPVVNEHNLLIGMVVKADIFRFMIQPGHIESCPVDWVMAKDVVSVHPDESVREAADKLLSNHIVAMPVVENSKVVGVVSVEDLLRYYSHR
ncbi:putative signal transduction protein with CBS domains [Desulfitobacterium hafniense DCB-2]|uniref:Putative signal transduction protein with CBS domains n=1 Tax=Desulfitobacterium hafniense (strain DSM 10664 / DCB-2) TaxID=272564 RepID=B8FV96_DESHD|nr:CBS domain-containing protein [Desulfitobacterium hafniense]ACL20605.1 putative signal transduction protein with CBS domains [Desulfitobacterium hafniense DCB-2]